MLTPSWPADSCNKQVTTREDSSLNTYENFLFLPSGSEPSDRQTVQHRQREATEDPSAHGNYLHNDARLDGPVEQVGQRDIKLLQIQGRQTEYVEWYQMFAAYSQSPDSSLYSEM